MAGDATVAVIMCPHASAVARHIVEVMNQSVSVTGLIERLQWENDRLKDRIAGLTDVDES